MRPKLYSHQCNTCNKSYFSPEEDKVFCCSGCEAWFKFHGRSHKDRGTPKRKPKVETDEKERWVTKKEGGNISRKTTNDFMYRDTFISSLPKRAKVVRG